MLARLVPVLVLALVACGPDRYHVKVPRSALGGERARLRGVMATEQGAHGEWAYAGDWTDELTLARADAQLCVLLALRDPAAYTLDDFTFDLALDGQPAPVTVEALEVTTIAAVADGEQATSPGRLMRGQVCTPARPTTRVDLHVIHRRLSFRGGFKPAPRYYQARYRWDLTD